MRDLAFAHVFQDLSALDAEELLVTSHAKMEENALVLINAHVLTGTLGKCAKQPNATGDVITEAHAFDRMSAHV